VAARVIDGKAVAAAVRERVKVDVEAFAAELGRTPMLATVLVGEDPASQIYIRKKGEACEEVGMRSRHHGLGADTPQEELLALVGLLGADPEVDGILVQLPLPKHLDEQAVIAAIDPAKLGIPEAWRGGDGADLTRIVVIIALFGWTTVARLVRGAALALREQEFVRAATALGATPLRIMRVHLLPNMASPIIVATTLSVGHVILFESVLSFLGLGIQPPLPSWGLMISEGQQYLAINPWMSIFPGLCIFMLVAGVQFLSQRFTKEGDQDLKMATRWSKEAA